MDRQTENGREPALPEKHAAGEGGRKVIEAEIIDSGDSSWSSGHARRNARGMGQNRTYVSRSLTFAPIDNTGCLAAFITLTLFFACLFQWGLLAAIGFIVFHTIGSVISSAYTARQLIRGLPFNIWSLRICNWIISFFITAWLAGGFTQ